MSKSYMKISTVRDIQTGEVLDRDMKYSLIEDRPYNIFHSVREGYNSFLNKLSEVPERLHIYFDNIYHAVFDVPNIRTIDDKEYKKWME